MKHSIVILCWNDTKVIDNCLSSIFGGTRVTDFEVIVSDNGSSDGTPEFIQIGRASCRERVCMLV